MSEVSMHMIFDCDRCRAAFRYLAAQRTPDGKNAEARCPTCGDVVTTDLHLEICDFPAECLRDLFGPSWGREEPEN